MSIDNLKENHVGDSNINFTIHVETLLNKDILFIEKYVEQFFHLNCGNIKDCLRHGNHCGDSNGDDMFF